MGPELGRRQDVTGSGRGLPLDPLAVAAAVALSLVAVLVGVRTGWSEMDVDEAVYRRALVAMQEGAGYYPAMRDALVVKEGAPPSQLRSIRPPTLYLALRPFPQASWRWLAGLAYLATLLGAWRLGRRVGEGGGVVAVAGGAAWVLSGAEFLFLHAEVWGLPLLVGGALALRRGDDRAAAALVLAAALVRELYAVALVAGLVVGGRRRPWVVALGVAAVAAVVHAALAGEVLAGGGRESEVGADLPSLAFLGRALSPGETPLAAVIGLPVLALGFAGLVRSWRHDGAARLLLPFAVVMAPATVLASRVYWTSTFGVAVWSFAAAAFRAPGASGDGWNRARWRRAERTRVQAGPPGHLLAVHRGPGVRRLLGVPGGVRHRQVQERR